MSFSIKRVYLIVAITLSVLWVAMAAWVLYSSPRRTSGNSVPVVPDSVEPDPSVVFAGTPVPEPQDCTAFFDIPGVQFRSWSAQPGETFAGLAARFGLREETLRSLNQANSRGIVLQPEDLVLIPSRDGIFHMVREGQGLSDIARAYGTPLGDLLAANRKLTDGDLRPGEVLFLPTGKFLWDRDPAWVHLRSLSRTTGFIRPIAARFSDAYGQRMHPIIQKEVFHGGLDLAAGMGTPVMAAQDGTVIFEGLRGHYGNAIVLEHGAGLTSWYGHLSQILVKKGQIVKRGDVIGKVGKTGRATGPHLHFEIRKENQPQNPLLYIEK
jgi:murein DD-endopeptidase MepM/ murein hydrolase activator NlpD